jgi:1,4-dihydroxy-2-naphthoate octaprenyltransferase
MNTLSQTPSVFGNTDIWKKSEWFLALLSLITSFFSISVVVFTRRDFGERYLGLINLYMGYLYMGYSVVASFMFLGNLLSAFTHFGSPMK